MHLYVVVLGSLFDVRECEVALSIADVRHLIKSRQCAANMRRVGHRLLARSRKRKSARRQRVDLRGIQSTVFCGVVRRLPGGFMCCCDHVRSPYVRSVLCPTSMIYPSGSRM